MDMEQGWLLLVSHMNFYQCRLKFISKKEVGHGLFRRLALAAGPSWAPIGPQIGRSFGCRVAAVLFKPQ